LIIFLDEEIHLFLLIQKVWAGQPFTFVPAIDNVIILDEPENLLKSGHFLRIPWLAGCAKDEGSLLVGGQAGST
jgi:hypothetical protein